MRALGVAMIVAVLLGIIPAARAQLPPGCGGMTPAQIEALRPPGICDPITYDNLRQAKSDACNVPGGRSCNPTHSCAELLRRKGLNENCLAARLNINNTCFCGGDAIHRGEVAIVEGSIATCNNLLASKNCSDCP